VVNSGLFPDVVERPWGRGPSPRTARLDRLAAALRGGPPRRTPTGLKTFFGHGGSALAGTGQLRTACARAPDPPDHPTKKRSQITTSRRRERGGNNAGPLILCDPPFALAWTASNKAERTNPPTRRTPMPPRERETYPPLPYACTCSAVLTLAYVFSFSTDRFPQPARRPDRARPTLQSLHADEPAHGVSASPSSTRSSAIPLGACPTLGVPARDQSRRGSRSSVMTAGPPLGAWRGGTGSSRCCGPGWRRRGRSPVARRLLLIAYYYSSSARTPRHGDRRRFDGESTSAPVSAFSWRAWS